jgi:hypothetical protein
VTATGVAAVDHILVQVARTDPSPDLADEVRSGRATVSDETRAPTRVHDLLQYVYRGRMSSTRLNVTIDEAAAQKLSAMARRMHVNEGTLARSLLLTAIDEADPDPANIVALLDGIDGAWEDAQTGWRQAQDGDTIPLDEL